MARDWTEIRLAYVTGKAGSLRECAEQYNVSLSSVAKASRRGGWMAEREQYGAKVAADALAEICSQNRVELVDQLDQLREVAGELLFSMRGAMEAVKKTGNVKAIRTMAGAMKDTLAVVTGVIRATVGDEDVGYGVIELSAVQEDPDDEQ